MAHEPSRPVGAEPKHPLQLKGAYALLARHDQVRRHKPLVQRNVRALHYGADAHGEFISTARTVVPARPHGLAAKLRDRSQLTTKRANWAIRPARGFKEFAGFIFVSEGRIGKIAHGFILDLEHAIDFHFSQGHSCRGDHIARAVIRATPNVPLPSLVS